MSHVVELLSDEVPDARLSCKAGRPDVEMLEDRLINWFGKNHGDDPQC